MNKKITMRRYFRFTAVLPLTFVLLTAQDQSKVAGFVEAGVDPQSYVDRYNKEESYKAWFDENFKEEWGTIYNAVGLPEPTGGEKPKVASWVEAGIDPQSYVDRYNRDPAFKNWFDGNYQDEWGSIYKAVGIEEPKVASWVEADADPQTYVDRYNQGGDYATWFDNYYKEKWGSIYNAVGLPEPEEEEMAEVAVATTEGDEPFIDVNGNGTWDDAEWWEDDNDNDEIDEAEPFVDANGDGIYNDSEFYDDANDNNEYDDGEKFYDTNDNGLIDDAEEFTDTNENGVWDGGPAIEMAVVDLAEGSSRGWNIGAAPSIGYLSGATFTNIPTGATMVINTPYGFKLGPFDFNVSAAFGGYVGQYDPEKDPESSPPPAGGYSVTEFNPTIIGVGGNLTFNLPFIPFDVFGEGHVGMDGEGPGVRGFGGVSLASLMKKTLNLPFNILVGGEVFISSDMAGAGNPSGWLSIGARLDYGF